MIHYFDKAGFEVYCPHLLGQAKHFPYVSENEAYDYFMNKVGFDKPVKSVLNLAKELKTKNAAIDIFLLGFSVGATIAWRCSQNDQLFRGLLDFMVQGSEMTSILRPPAKRCYFSGDRSILSSQGDCECFGEKKKLCVTIVEESMDSPILILRLFTLNLKSLLSGNR